MKIGKLPNAQRTERKRKNRPLIWQVFGKHPVLQHHEAIQA
jgi:hypothetical protein